MIHSISAPLMGGAGTQAAVLNNKAAIPVAPSSLLYAHFEHVSGIPAPEGVNGVSVSKLKILDTMIERLRQIRAEKTAADTNGPAGETAREDARQIDARIEALKKEMAAQNDAASALPYRPKASMEAGTFFNLNV